MQDSAPNNIWDKVNIRSKDILTDELAKNIFLFPDKLSKQITLRHKASSPIDTVKEPRRKLAVTYNRFR